MRLHPQADNSPAVPCVGVAISYLNGETLKQQEVQFWYQKSTIACINPQNSFSAIETNLRRAFCDGVLERPSPLHCRARLNICESSFPDGRKNNGKAPYRRSPKTYTLKIEQQRRNDECLLSSALPQRSSISHFLERLVLLLSHAGCRPLPQVTFACRVSRSSSSISRSFSLSSCVNRYSVGRESDSSDMQSILCYIIRRRALPSYVTLEPPMSVSVSPRASTTHLCYSRGPL